MGRHPGRVRLPPFRELKLRNAAVPVMMAPLPFKSTALLTVQITMRKIHVLSKNTTSFEKQCSSRRVSWPGTRWPRRCMLPSTLDSARIL